MWLESGTARDLETTAVSPSGIWQCDAGPAVNPPWIGSDVKGGGPGVREKVGSR